MEVVVDAYDGGAQVFLSGHHAYIGQIGGAHHNDSDAAPFHGAELGPRRGGADRDGYGQERVRERAKQSGAVRTMMSPRVGLEAAAP